MKKIQLSTQMLLATILAVAAGLLLQVTGNAEIATNWIAPIGTLFLNFMQMIIIPLIFCTLVTGICDIKNLKEYGKIGGKTLISFFAMTVLAAFIGLTIGMLFSVGSGVSASETGEVTVPAAVSIIDTVVGFVPSNVFAAFSSGNMMGIVIFGVILGIGMVSVGEKSAPLYDVIDSVKEIVMKITVWIMKAAPIGIFAIVTETIAENGIDMFLSMIGLVAVVYLAFFLNNFLVYGGSALVSGTGIVRFYKASMEPLVFAFTSQTSAAAIPFINRALDRMNVSESVKGFVVPLGNAMHKNGTALYQCVFTVFLANYYQVEITPSLFIAVVFAATVSAMGTAGVPQGGMVTLGMVLTAAGIPLEGVSLVAGLISLVGMGSTMNNVGGDLATAILVDRGFDGKKEVANSSDALAM